MIEFGCKNCGQKLSVQDQYSGKRVKCPKCGSVCVVPDNSDKIKFNCKNCGQSIRVPQIYTDKKRKCPKCKNPVVVPSLKKEPADGAGTFSIVCSMCNEAVQVPETSRGQTIECPECGSYIETSSEAAQGKSDSSGDEDLYQEETGEYEESEGVDRRIIVGVSAVAAVVVVGFIILIAVLRSSGSRPTERPEDLRIQQQVADTDSQQQPVTSDTQPTDLVVQGSPKEDALPEEPVSLEDKLFKQTKIAFQSEREGKADIYVMNADGSEQKRLTNNPAHDLGPTWSPDGKKIAFYSGRYRGFRIYVMNADGSEQKNLTKTKLANDGHPSWSPDGKKIAFHSQRDGNTEIYVMNPDGSGSERLTNNPAYDLDPSWSPDGKKIAFYSQRGGNYDIYVMNADGSEQKRLANPVVGRFPSWSPDGKKIAFYSNRDGNYEIYVMNPDGSEQKNLTNNPAHDSGPSWSPDGKKIAFHSTRDGNREIYVMNADGSEQERLTNNPARDLYPSWSPFIPSEPQLAEEPGREQGAVDDTDSQLRPVTSNSQPEEPVEAVPLPKPGDVVTNSIGMKLVYIPAGSFMMGISEFPQHQVRISEAFWMGQTEVTQGQYESVMNAQPWSGRSYVQEDANSPAVYVNWDDAVAFCRKLSQQEGKTYRLPNEAEWEYACRAGTTTRFSFGDSDSSLGDYAWFHDNARKVWGQEYAHSVGQKKPNPWGLYDMHGNVWELCSVWAGSSSHFRPFLGDFRSLRGGSWNSGEFNLRCSGRNDAPPGRFDADVGFRVVLSQP